MIYTIGNRESYDAGIAELGDDFRKLGITDRHPNITEPYGGGIAFETVEEAKEFIRSEPATRGHYEVYGLCCAWDNTYFDETMGHHRIKETSKIIRI